MHLVPHMRAVSQKVTEGKEAHHCSRHIHLLRAAGPDVGCVLLNLQLQLPSLPRLFTFHQT